MYMGRVKIHRYHKTDTEQGGPESPVQVICISYDGFVLVIEAELPVCADPMPDSALQCPVASRKDVPIHDSTSIG